MDASRSKVRPAPMASLRKRWSSRFEGLPTPRPYNEAVDDLVQRVAHSMERRGLLTRPGHLGVAVSGGPDSVCLLYVLVDLAGQWGRPLHVLHLDHGLRGEESRGDAEFVRGLADSLGIPCTIR